MAGNNISDLLDVVTKIGTKASHGRIPYFQIYPDGSGFFGHEGDPQMGVDIEYIFAFENIEEALDKALELMHKHNGGVV